MVSPYIIVILACMIFWCTYFLCARRQTPSYSTGELIVMYLLVRILPFFSLEHRNANNLLCLALEWVILGLLYYYTSCNKSQKAQETAIACYLFQPVTACCMLGGEVKGIYITFAVLALLCILDTIETRRKRSLLAYLPEYLIGNTGIFLWFVATRILQQRFSQIGRTEQIPVCYIVSLGVMGIAFIGLLLRLFDPQERGEAQAVTEDVEDESVAVTTTEAESEDATEKAGFTKWDYIWMAILTLLFAVAVFYRIGSLHVPETYERMQVTRGGMDGENQIVLEFEKDTTISRLYIFLGYQAKRSISFSAKEQDRDEWYVFDSQHEIENAFAWNEVEVNRTLQSFGMVLMQGDADLCEVVCLDGDGNRILPENAAQYPKLFDEQELFIENATYYDQTMFDEVYHGRTAYEFLHRLPIYENTHPPLGKSLISIGIALFGMNPFGWRFMCGIFGVLMIPLCYLFAHKMFAKTDLACFTTVLAGTGFMNTTLARIATIDIIVAFFVLLTFYFMYGYVDSLKRKEGHRKQLLWLSACGIAMALAISTKWTGIYAGVGIAIIFFYFLADHIGGIRNIRGEGKYLTKTLLWCVVFFVVIPLLIYTLSYIPFARVYTDRNLVEHMIENGELMLSYHSDCVFDHPYFSEWYEWLIDIKPLADSRVYFADETVSVVMTFLNPLLCLGGLAALLYQFYLWRSRHSKKALFLLITYFSMLLPWLLVHRTVFIYQYFISAMIFPFMIAAAVQDSRHRRRNMMLIAGVSVVLYLIYYPVLTGQTVSVEWVNRFLEAFERWNIA